MTIPEGIIFEMIRSHERVQRLVPGMMVTITPKNPVDERANRDNGPFIHPGPPPPESFFVRDKSAGPVLVTPRKRLGKLSPWIGEPPKDPGDREELQGAHDEFMKAADDLYECAVKYLAALDDGLGYEPLWVHQRALRKATEDYYGPGDHD